MKGKLTLVLLASALTAFGAWDSVRKGKGRTTEGNVVVWDKHDAVTEVAVSVGDLTNAVDAVSTTNGPNELLKLNTEGKIDVDLVETITVVFVGGEAIDI